MLNPSNIELMSSSSSIIGYVWGSMAIFGLIVRFLTPSTVSGPYTNSYYFDGYATFKVQNRLVKDAMGLMLNQSTLQLCYYQQSNQVVHFRRWSLSSTDSIGFYTKILSYLD